MAKLPEYIREGWSPHGPGGCRCPRCGASVTTNALGRARHRETCEGWKAFRTELKERRQPAAKEG